MTFKYYQNGWKEIPELSLGLFFKFKISNIFTDAQVDEIDPFLQLYLNLGNLRLENPIVKLATLFCKQMPIALLGQ